jgi:hypothetical protein
MIVSHLAAQVLPQQLDQVQPGRVRRQQRHRQAVGIALQDPVRLFAGMNDVVVTGLDSASDRTSLGPEEAVTSTHAIAFVAWLCSCGWREGTEMEQPTAHDAARLRSGMFVAACLCLCILLFLTQIDSTGRTAPLSDPTPEIASGRLFWPEDGVPLCTANRNQERPVIISDGAGGAIVAWEDYRGAASPYGPTNIYAQRVYSDGLAAWTLNGIAVSLAPDDQGRIQMIGDGEGRAIVAWRDWRGGTADIYAQRLSAGGEAVWASDGIPLCAAADGQYWPTIAADGAGGAIVAWEDYRNGAADVYAQCVHADGTVAWTADGISLTVAAGDQVSPKAAGDGAGGAIVVWEGGCGAEPGICAQRVNADGALAWPADGVWLSQELGLHPQITADGEGGAIAAWQVGNWGDADVYAQRVYADGTVAWTENGVALCLAPGGQINPVLRGDGAGGAIVAWQDERTGESDPRVYAQRIYADGTVAWATDGIQVTTGADDRQWYPDIASDGEGGAILAWGGTTAPTVRHIYAQRLSDEGALLWGGGGLLVCGVTGMFGGGQDLPHLAANEVGRAIVVWDDNRRWYKEDELDIYVQRIGEGPRTYLPLVGKGNLGGER